MPAGGDPLLNSSILVDARHRQLLAAIQGGSAPLTERDLAVHLAAQEADKSPSAVTKRERKEAQIALHHRYLPKMDQAGLIERQGDGYVATGQLPLEDLDRELPRTDDPGVQSWEALGALLARPRRQDIVSILADRRDPITLEDLASEVAQDQRSRTTDGGEAVPGLQATLHHVDLPTLDDVGLIDYDREKKTITRGPPLGHSDA